MANRKFLKIAILMSAFLYSNLVFGSEQTKSESGASRKTNLPLKKLMDGKLLRTPAAEAAKSRVSDFIKSRPLGECVVLTLIQSQKILQILMDELFDMEKIRSRLQKLMPSVQEKMKKAGADRSGLDKDPEIQEAMKLYIEGEKMSNQQQELVEAAEYLLKQIVTSINPNARVLKQPGEFIGDEDADHKNHIFFDVIELYIHCIRQVHAEMMASKTENAKEVPNDKASTAKKSDKKQQLSSDVQKSSSAIKSKL